MSALFRNKKYLEISMIKIRKKELKKLKVVGTK